MSQVITRNAHAQTHANSELPGATPPDLPNTLPHNDPLVPPIPVCPSHAEELEDNQENPLPSNNAGGPLGPNGDPDPSDDRPDGIPDGDDRDKRSTEEPNNDNLFEAHRGADNPSVQDLLHILGPILMECQSPPHPPCHTSESMTTQGELT